MIASTLSDAQPRIRDQARSPGETQTNESGDRDQEEVARRRLAVVDRRRRRGEMLRVRPDFSFSSCSSRPLGDARIKRGREGADEATTPWNRIHALTTY